MNPTDRNCPTVLFLSTRVHVQQTYRDSELNIYGTPIAWDARCQFGVLRCYGFPLEQVSVLYECFQKLSHKVRGWCGVEKVAIRGECRFTCGAVWCIHFYEPIWVSCVKGFSCKEIIQHVGQNRLYRCRLFNIEVHGYFTGSNFACFIFSDCMQQQLSVRYSR